MLEKDKLKEKAMSEKETREKILRFARLIGAEGDVKNLFSKWDKAIALAPPSEKDEMANMAILEIQNLLDIRAKDGLTIDGKIIVKSEE